jgi:hypothetical protein
MRYINNVVIQYNNNVDIQLLATITHSKSEKLHFMKKKNDTELMNDFNKKYSKMNYDEFLDKIMENYNDCKYTILYKKILNTRDFSEYSNWSQLISMKVALTKFSPTEADLKHILLERLKPLQVVIDKN